MKIELELSELELRAMMYELWNANQRRCWQSTYSGRMFLSDNPHHFEDKIDDMQFQFKRQTINKIREQLKTQGINTAERYALIYDEEIPEVKNFLITNKIKPMAPEHAGWLNQGR